MEDKSEQYIETIMHMLFLGVTKMLGMMIRDLLTLYSRWSLFFKTIQPYLRCLRGYSLHYCREWTYGSHDKPFGPWVSENHLAYARCLKMVSLNLSLLLGGRNEEERQHAFECAETTINTWASCIALLMKKPSDRENSNRAERHIKLFLSSVGALGNVIIEKKKKTERVKDQGKRKIQSVSNFIGLLNLPDQMRRFGNLRDYWEGSFRGERILQELKPLVRQGTYHPWFARSALRKYYTDKSMSMIMNEESEHNKNDTDEQGNKYSMYYRYESMDAIQKHLEEGMPLSGLIVSEGTLYVAMGRNRQLHFCEIEPCDDNGKLFGVTYYCTLRIGKTVTSECDVNIIKEAISDYVLMLPHLDAESGILNTSDGLSLNYYLVVNSKWQERVYEQDSVKFSLPIVSSVIY